MPEGGRRYTGPAFRAHHPHWAYDPLSGEGARLHGGRFNRKGRQALYLSLNYQTAYLEAARGTRLPPPMTLVSYMIDCEDIFDPSDIESAVRYGIGAEDLGCSDWFAEMTAGRTPRSQEVAEELFNIGFAGMIYPSFVRNAPIGSRNIVLWQWGGEKPYMVKALDPEGVLLRKGADAEAIKS